MAISNLRNRITEQVEGDILTISMYNNVYAYFSGWLCYSNKLYLLIKSCRLGVVSNLYGSIYSENKGLIISTD